MILGMDVIQELGGSSLADNKVVFGDNSSHSGICALVTCKEREPDIDDNDFEAWLKGVTGP